MKTIFMDFDGTIVNSRKSYCDTYTQLYSNHEDYVHPNWHKPHKWNLVDMCPLATENLFDHDLFYYKLEFMDNAYSTLKLLSKLFDIVICSIGTYDNISKKSAWIKNHLPFITKSIFINNGFNHTDKSIIDMKDGIIIDDVDNNLITSNAKYKICFGETFDWNRNWMGDRCANWDELDKRLYQIKQL